MQFPHSNVLCIVQILRLLTVEGEVIKEKPHFLRQLKQAVEALTQSISTDICRRLIENFAVLIKPAQAQMGHVLKI